MTRLALLLALVLSAPLTAQDGRVHVLLVSGLGGEPAVSRAFEDVAMQIRETARTRWGVADSSLIYLAEQRTGDSVRINGRSTREEIDAAVQRLSHRAAPGDVVLVVVIGHGSGEGAESRVNMPGPDPTAADWRNWLAGFAQQSVVVVIAASGSGDFLAQLSAPNRVVMTATRSPSERNASLFPAKIALGLTSGDADADKDGAVSALEAYRYTKSAVARAYDDDKRLMTEHAQLDDNGDQIGSADPGVAPSLDGALAARITFKRRAESTDPRVVALVAERRALEAQLADLRARKATTDSTAYARDLEALLLEIAKRTRAIRLIEQGGTP